MTSPDSAWSRIACRFSRSDSASTRVTALEAAVAILAAYDNLIKLIGGYAKLGHIDPVVFLWGACLLFNGLGLWLYLSSPGQGGMTPLRGVLRAFGGSRQTRPNSPASPGHPR